MSPVVCFVLAAALHPGFAARAAAATKEYMGTRKNRKPAAAADPRSIPRRGRSAPRTNGRQAGGGPQPPREPGVARPRKAEAGRDAGAAAVDELRLSLRSREEQLRVLAQRVELLESREEELWTMLLAAHARLAADRPADSPPPEVVGDKRLAPDPGAAHPAAGGDGRRRRRTKRPAGERAGRP